MKKPHNAKRRTFETKSVSAEETEHSSLEHKEVSFEIKASGEADPDGYFRFEGYGSTFGNKDLVDDIIVEGAFKESLENELPILLWQHRYMEPIGVPERIYETESGLMVHGIMPADDDFVKGRVMPQLRIRSVKAMSIGYIVEDYFIKDGIRYITKATLKEISLVTFPANPKAVVTGVKSIDLRKVEKMTKRDLEETLREVGFSQKAAVFIASKFPEQSESGSGSGKQSESVEEDDAVLKKCADVLKAFETEKVEEKLKLLLNKM